jgi:hypothetical protein
MAPASDLDDKTKEPESQFVVEPVWRVFYEGV